MSGRSIFFKAMIATFGVGAALLVLFIIAALFTGVGVALDRRAELRNAPTPIPPPHLTTKVTACIPNETYAPNDPKRRISIRGEITNDGGKTTNRIDIVMNYKTASGTVLDSTTQSSLTLSSNGLWTGPANLPPGGTANFSFLLYGGASTGPQTCAAEAIGYYDP